MKDNERITEEEFSVMLLKFPELIYALYHRAEDEIDRLNANNQAMQEEMAKTWKIADDYKSRIDKAKEYIKHEWFKREQIGISHLSFSYDELQKILNILNGGDE